jgi:hypothetical protein
MQNVLCPYHPALPATTSSNQKNSADISVGAAAHTRLPSEGTQNPGPQHFSVYLV